MYAISPARLLLLTLALSAIAHAAEPQTLALWPQLDPPGSVTTEVMKERGDAAHHNRFISEITLPTLEVYLPPKESATGMAIVICPGGGYSGVAIDKEGHDVARWLNSIGVAGIVLKYRMPRPEVTRDGAPLPLLDVQRALRLVRSHAQEWNLKRDRIGVMGFSAGGHLASMAATMFNSPDQSATDALARLSDRPDFVILIYPVISMADPIAHGGSRRRLLGETPTPQQIERFSTQTRVTPQTPPTFLVHAKDDRVKADNSLLFHAALEKAGVACELHLFEKGGHGFGLGAGRGEVSDWPGRCANWLERLEQSKP